MYMPLWLNELPSELSFVPTAGMDLNPIATCSVFLYFSQRTLNSKYMCATLSV